MADILTSAERSARMASIPAKDTKPELKLRRALWRRGMRYRLHRKELPGRPDIVFVSAQLAVFVHGCFWHRHSGCRATRMPKTNRRYWRAKFASNMHRDRRTRMELAAAGWRIEVIWTCELTSTEKVEMACQRIEESLFSAEANQK